ncbi:MAG: hypothetical protein ACLP1X_01640 [Polyangiaceae bacterium]|jgi:hypothetical protein
MHTSLKGILPITALTALIGATACSSGPLPATRAAGVERLQCDASPNSQDQLVRSLKVLHVQPLYTHTMTGGDNAEERVNGATLLVRPPSGISPEQLTRALQCHGARTVLGQLSSTPNDPYFLPDRWVTIEVKPEGGNFAITLSSDSVHDNLQVFSRAHHYADEHAVATDPGLP